MNFMAFRENKIMVKNRGIHKSGFYCFNYSLMVKNTTI